jgi:hypothetical protein
MINFGGTPQRAGTWSWFKPLIAAKSLKIQFEEDDDLYLVYGYDMPEVLTCTIWKGTLLPSVVDGGYSQAQNDADKADFEANYEPEANRSIDDVPSLIIANSIKAVGGGSADMSVDGSVTPVVFEYNPPNNYDVEITALSLLFEDVTAWAFGNNFLRSGLATLANGLLLEVKAGDQTVTWQNMKRTRDLVEICTDFDLVTGTPNFFRARIHLPRSLRLSRAGTYAQPDFLRLTVRDSLTTFDFAEAHFQGVKL